jgi:hypothetical protein
VPLSGHRKAHEAGELILAQVIGGSPSAIAQHCGQPLWSQPRELPPGSSPSGAACHQPLNAAAPPNNLFLTDSVVKIA